MASKPHLVSHSNMHCLHSAREAIGTGTQGRAWGSQIASQQRWPDCWRARGRSQTEADIFLAEKLQPASIPRRKPRPSVGGTQCVAESGCTTGRSAAVQLPGAERSCRRATDSEMDISHGSGHTSFILSGGGITGILTNGAFLSAFLSFAIAQVVKVFTHWYMEGRWDLTRLVGSGGMPSSHSALMLGLTASIGVSTGTDSPTFAICLVVSLIVMYDACGVRLQAGRHAGILNQIISELPSEHPASDLRQGPLKDRLGHTPLQVVVGGLVGMVVGYITQVSIDGLHGSGTDTHSTPEPVHLGGHT